MTMTHTDNLRSWTRNSYALEAATELLNRAFAGRFARPGNPWVITDPDTERNWIDFEAIPDYLGGLSSGERRLLLIAASLADVGVDVVLGDAVLGDAVTGLDQDVLELVLAAIAHASGSHQHPHVITDAEGFPISITPHASLSSWPDEA